MRVTILFFFIIFGYFLRDIGRQRRGGGDMMMGRRWNGKSSPSLQNSMEEEAHHCGGWLTKQKGAAIYFGQDLDRARGLNSSNAT